MYLLSFCHVCLRGGPDARLVRDPSLRVFFTDVVRLISEDVPEVVPVCTWCAVSTRKALALCENAVSSAPFIQYMQSAVDYGHPAYDVTTMVENTILHQEIHKKLYPLLLSTIHVEDIPAEDIKIAVDTLDLTELKKKHINTDANINNSEKFIKIEDAYVEKENTHRNENQFINYANDNASLNIYNEHMFNEFAPENVDDSESNGLYDRAIDLEKKLVHKKQKENKNNNTQNVSVSKVTKKFKKNLKKDQANENTKGVEESQFKVVYLTIEEQLQEIEHSRISDKYLKSKFRCEACGLGFVGEDVFNGHMKRHDESFGEHKCNICTIRFTTNEVLLQHTLAHRRYYRCLLCTAVVRRRCHCSAHRARCGGGAEPSACNICSKMFRDEFSLKQHVRDIHLKVKQYECFYCSKMFGQKQKLSVHIRSHTGERPFKCDICKRHFSTNSNLKSHQVVHGVAEPGHYCVECHTHFKSMKNLKRHFETSLAHQDGTARYPCPKCRMLFSTEKRLASHLSYIHLRVKKYICHICAGVFSSSGSLTRHTRNVHHVEYTSRRHVCDICGSSFTAKSTLDAHRTTHIQDQ